MTTPRFSICIPTHRPLVQTQRALQSAYDLCKRNGYAFAVSDSSGDRDKYDFLHGLMQGEEHMTHIDSPPCGMIQNWFQALHGTTTPFVMLMGDDDTIFEYDNGPDLDNLPADVVGVRPNILSYHPGSGLQRIYNAPITSEHGAQRVLEYITTANGANSGVICFWRRDVLEPIMNLWLNHHPTKGNYCDWAVMSALSAAGKVLVHPTMCYFYNIHNWIGGADHVQEQVEKSYALGGLPPGSAAYEGIFNALDSFLFTNHNQSPLSYEDRFIAAAFSLNIYLDPYLKAPYHGKNGGTVVHDNAAAINALCAELVGLDDIPAILELLVQIVDAIKPGLGALYRDFYTTATGRDWGTY